MSGAPASRIGSRSPLAAIFTYTLRACLPARRIVLLLPVVGGALFGLLSQVTDQDRLEAFVQVAGASIHALVLPITCLVIGDAILGAEVRSGTFAFTWLSPVPHRTIAVGRWLGGWAIAAGVMVPGVVAGAILAGAPEAIAPEVIASVAGAGAYLALFVAIGASFKRGVVWSLAFVILVERLLGAALSGIAQLSPGWLAQAVLVGLTDVPGGLHRSGIPHGWPGVIRLALVTAVCLAIANWRLGAIKPASSAD